MFKKLLTAGLLAACAVPAMAQEAIPNVSPAMWVAKDDDTTIYMFGTFHLLDGKRDWFNDEVKAAFDASDELIVEAILPENPAELQPLVMELGLYKDGTTLSSKLPAEAKQKLVEQFGAQGLAGLDPMEPWLVMMTLSALEAQKLGLNPENGPETILSKAAKARNMPIGELESARMQLTMFDSMPEEQQIEGLVQTLEQMDELGEMFPKMLTAWSDGDTEALVEVMEIEEEPELHKWMFTDRNAKWAEWIDARMDKPGTVFMAVGAGHLAGKGSVQDYLAQKGITSTRVTQ